MEKRDKSKFHVHGVRFKYLGCVLDVSGTDGTECSRKLANGRRFAGAIRSLFNARDLQLECARVLCLFLCMAVR